MASPKQPQEVTTLNAAETKVSSVKNKIKANKALTTQFRQKPNNSNAPNTISKAHKKMAIPVDQLFKKEK